MDAVPVGPQQLVDDTMDHWGSDQRGGPGLGPVDQPVGSYVPERIAALDIPVPDATVVAALERITGLSPAFSDELDLLGLRSVVPASKVPPLRATDKVIGRAITLRYLPARSVSGGPTMLAHLTLAVQARPGDVMVITAPHGLDASVLGGKAAAAAVQAGIVGCVVSGAVRDVDEIVSVGLRTWASIRTPLTGRGRLEAIEINGPLDFVGVQVVPGDIVVADESGIAFVPAEAFASIAERLLRA